MIKRTMGIAIAVIFGFGILIVSIKGTRSTANAQEAGKGGATAAPAPKGADQKSAPAPQASPEVKFEPEKLPKVVATVNKTDIGRDVFARIIEGALMNQHGGGPLTAERLKTLEGMILDRLIKTELLAGEAAASKIKPDDKAIASQFENIKSHFKSEEEFNKALKDQKMTTAQLKDDIKKDLSIRALLDEKVFKGIKVTEADAKKFYDSNKDKFAVPETVRASHIIIKVDKNADDAKKAEAKKKIEEVQTKLKAGEKFEELAKKYSEDGSKASGGDLGFFPRGAMVKEFEDKAFSMKPGETSGIFSTQFGYHIVKLVEHKPAGTAAFDDVKADVQRGMEGDLKREKTMKYLDELKGKAKIKTFM